MKRIGKEACTAKQQKKGPDKKMREESECQTFSGAGRRSRGRVVAFRQHSHPLQSQQGLSCFLGDTTTTKKMSSTKVLKYKSPCAEALPSTSAWLETSSSSPWTDSWWWPDLQTQTPSKGGPVPPRWTSSAWGTHGGVKSREWRRRLEPC